MFRYFDSGHIGVLHESLSMCCSAAFRHCCRELLWSLRRRSLSFATASVCMAESIAALSASVFSCKAHNSSCQYLHAVE